MTSLGKMLVFLHATRTVHSAPPLGPSPAVCPVRRERTVAEGRSRHTVPQLNIGLIKKNKCDSD